MGQIRRRARRTGKLPLRACALSAGWRTTGRARVLIVREQRDGRWVVGRFEIDRWCLGLVSAEASCDVDRAELRRLRDETFPESPPISCSPELAAAIVHGGIEYASRLGFAPHPAWAIAQHVLPPPALAAYEHVEFGREGKPCYVAGAGDDDTVLALLEQRLGEDAFNVLLE
jgi:hypothetical protein